MNTAMRAVARIDLDAAVENMEAMHKNLPEGTGICAVVKANGYGHGATRIAKKLEPLSYVWGYAVATVEEGIDLRKNGVKKPILILGYAFPYCYEDLVTYEIRPAVFRADQIEELSDVAVKMDRKLKIHIAVDTGMSRIGITPDEEGLSFVRHALSLPGIEIEGLFTHFAKADMTEGVEDTRKQYEKLMNFSRRIAGELSFRVPIVHCSNSAAIVQYQEKNHAGLCTAAGTSIVRAGITLYGMEPSDETDLSTVPLKPVMGIYSHVVYIKTIHRGDAVSYGGTFVAGGDVRVATIPFGYADGYPRSLSNKGYVLIRGHKAKILGRVCMDQMMVDITGFDDIQMDDIVTVMGQEMDEDSDGNLTPKKGGLSITAEELGNLSGRFNYELVCDISDRVPRLYVG